MNDKEMQKMIEDAIIDCDLDPQIIDDLQEKLINKGSENFYYIDIFPQTLNYLSRDIEHFFLEHYHKEYAHKIIRIIVKIMGYYPVQILLSGEHHSHFHKKIKYRFSYTGNEFIPLQSYQDLADILLFVITRKHSFGDVVIVIGTKEDNDHALIRIDNGLFSVRFSNLSPEHVELFTILAEQEGLFLIQNKDYYPTIKEKQEKNSSKVKEEE